MKSETTQPNRTLVDDEPVDFTLGVVADEATVVIRGPLDRIADSLERLVELIEVSMQPTEEADEVLDPDAGLVMVQATTPDGVARSYIVRTGSTKAAWEAACSAWDCTWGDLTEKSVEMEE